MERYTDRTVTIIPNRLYWLSDKNPPEGIKNAFYFCTDKDLKYYPFFSDFGPLNIAQVSRFCGELEKLLKMDTLLDKAIYHYTSEKSTERLNSAFIMGAFMVS
jgi:cell division cycle 14